MGEGTGLNDTALKNEYRRVFVMVRPLYDGWFFQ